jgi:ribonuclease HI
LSADTQAVNNMDEFDSIINDVYTETNNMITKKGYHIIRQGIPNEEDCYLLQFDGVSVPNPGPSAGACVIYMPLQTPSSVRTMFIQKAHYISNTFNSEAEYAGLILGLETAKNNGIKQLIIEGDSELVIHQVDGKYKIKDLRISKINNIVKNLLKNFDFVAIRHIKRENNKNADALTYECVNLKKSFCK